MADIDECVSNPCHSDATCSNVPGNFTCTCDTGFTGNGESCTGKFKLKFKFRYKIYSIK